MSANGILHAAGGYGPPGGGGFGGPPPGGGYGPPGGGGHGGPPPGGGFGPPPGGGFGGGGPGFGPPGGFPPPGGPMVPGGPEVNSTLPLILNIAAAVLCGGMCITFLLSIVGIVFAVQAGNAKNVGDIATAQAKAKTSMLMFIISVALGFVGCVIAVIVQLLRS